MRKNKLLMGSVISLLLFGGCEEKKPVQMAAPVVGVSRVVKQNIPLEIEVPAKITGSLEIQVRAQVGGILKSRNFKEGEFVHQGSKLFEIDEAPYRAALTRAQGSLAQAESELRRTSRDYERMQKLHNSKAVSQKEYDDSLSAYERAQANMKVAEGALHEAEINLGYTEVKAPISGIVRKEAQSVGNLISPNGESSLLTSMVQICPLHANFSISGSTWASVGKSFHSGKVHLAKKDEARVQVIMADGTVYPQEGKIIFIDSSEDNQTSSISAKAEIPSSAAQKMLLPGQFVRVRILGHEYKDALIIPATALISTQAGFMVYVVKEDKTVEVRPVKAEVINNKAVISGGLKENEAVIYEGIIKARPGQPVTPVFDESKPAEA
jgi:membrane fusion protein (multidrug efflux system)